MARTKDKRFRDLNKSIDKGAFAKMNLAQRMTFLDTSEGRGMLNMANFTAQELSAEFPYPDKKTKEKLGTIISGKYGVTMPGDKGTSIPTTLKDRATNGGYSRGSSDPGSKAQLTADQKEIFDLLQKGQLSADDPRIGFLKNISDDDLKKAGIQKSTGEDGKVIFKSDPTRATQMSEEELAASVRARNVPGGSPYLVNQRQGYLDELNANSELKDRFMRAMRAEAGGRTDKLADVMEATFNRAHMKGNSIDAELRSGFFGPVNRNDLNYTNPLDDRVRSSATDALNQVGQGRNRIQLRTDQGMATDPGGRVYETMADKSGKLNFGDGNNYYFMGERGRSWYQQQEQARQAYDIAHSKSEGGPITREQIAEERTRLAAEEVQRRQQILAGTVTNQQSVSAQPAGRNDNRGLYVAGDSIGQGVANASRANSLAVNGKRFTDPTLLDQLRNVPKGATVQIYGGTNDAAGGIVDPKLYAEQMARIKKMSDDNGFKVSIHGPAKSSKQWDTNSEQIDAIMRQSSQDSGLTYRSNREFTADAEDGVHFSSRSYGRIAQSNVAASPSVEQLPSMPDGGELQTNADTLDVYNLDKNKLQRDNMIAVDGDGKPQFTMNSKEEMKFNPNTGSVEVDNGARGFKNNPDQLGPEPAQPMESQKTGSQEKLEQQSQQVSNNFRPLPPPVTSTESGPNSRDVSVALTENVFTTPSIERAVARARFQNTSDSLGGHFDYGATNMV